MATTPPHVKMMKKFARWVIDGPRRGVLTAPVRSGKSTAITRGSVAQALAPEGLLIVRSDADWALRDRRALRECVDVDRVGVMGIHTSTVPEGDFGAVIIDDPYRNFEEARSPNANFKIIGTIARLDRHFGGRVPILLVGSRWGADDVFAFFIRSGWPSLNIPAITSGRSYWPDLWPVEELVARREEMSEDDPDLWRWQYQGVDLHPVDREGKVTAHGR